MPTKNWWFKFDFNRWRTDSELRECSLETRGLWIDILCVMHEKGVYEITGTYERLSRLLGSSANEIARCARELKETKAADVTLGNGTVTLLSRRLKRELSSREKTRLRVRKLRGNDDVTLQSKSNKKEVREEAAIAAPPLREIFVGTVLTGVAKNLSLKKLSLSANREWMLAADLAYENGFTAEEFVECHADLCEKRSYTILPQYVTDGLPNFLKTRRKVVTLPSPEQVRQEDAERTAPLRRAPGVVP